MTLKDYIDKKIPLQQQEDFCEHWSIVNINETIESYWNNLEGKDWIEITCGIDLIGLLEIKDLDFETKFIKYAQEILSDPEFTFEKMGYTDILESILRNLGKIGTKRSLDFLEKIAGIFLSIKPSEFKSVGNVSSIISACQFSYLLISDDTYKTKEYFDKTIVYRKQSIPDKEEIDSFRKEDPLYAQYLDYLYQNYRDLQT